MSISRHCGKNHIPLKFASHGIAEFASDCPKENFIVYTLPSQTSSLNFIVIERYGIKRDNNRDSQSQTQ